MKKFFLVCVELHAPTTEDRVEKLRDEIEQHAKAVVPFYTHQQPVRLDCLKIIDDQAPNDWLQW